MKESEPPFPPAEGEGEGGSSGTDDMVDMADTRSTGGPVVPGGASGAGGAGGAGGSVIPFGRAAPTLFKPFLEERGFKENEFTRLGYSYRTGEQTSQILGYPCHSDSVQIDYFAADGSPLFEDGAAGSYARLRLLQVDGQGKYRQPRGTGVHARLTPHCRWDWTEVAREPGCPVLLVEGEFKADLANLRDWGQGGAESEPAVVGLGGVDAWTGRRYGTALVPELNPWVWQGRVVYVCFDHDVHAGPAGYKPGVQKAMDRLCATLIGLGARVSVVHLGRTAQAKEGRKLGLDDYIRAGGRWESLVMTATGMDESQDPVRQLLARYGLWRPTGGVIDLVDGHVWKRISDWDSVVSHLLVPTGAEEKLVPASRLWRVSPRRTIIEGFCNDARHAFGVLRVRAGGAGAEGSGGAEDGGEGALYFNRWSGWGHRPEQVPEVDALWPEFVGRLLGEERAKWFHQWAAWAFQRPWSRNTTSWFLISRREGIGKSLLFESVALAAGKCGRVVGPDALGSRWNVGLFENRVFLAVNELAEGRVDVRRFKNYRTADTVELEEKGQPRYVAHNHVNFMVSSNEEATHETTADARRDIVVRPSAEATAGGEAGERWVLWLRQVVAPLMKSERGARGLLDFYLRYPVDGWDPSAPAPGTQERQVMASVTRSGTLDLAQQLVEVLGPGSEGYEGGFVLRIGALVQLCEDAGVRRGPVWKHICSLTDTQRVVTRVNGDGLGVKHRCYAFVPHEDWKPLSWKDEMARVDRLLGEAGFMNGVA
jgi:hypothetical protein